MREHTEAREEVNITMKIKRALIIRVVEEVELGEASKRILTETEMPSSTTRVRGMTITKTNHVKVQEIQLEVRVGLHPASILMPRCIHLNTTTTIHRKWRQVV